MAARITQDVVEVLILPDSSKVRLTQDVIEVLVAPSSQQARVTQDVVEVVRDNRGGGTVLVVWID